MRYIILIIVMFLVACGGRYTGDSQYYWQDGVLWSCRENVKKPLCRIDYEWPDKGLQKYGNKVRQ